jgi:hypothetical protein
MHLTDRQQLFFDYLLERLDFLPDSFLQEYIKALFFHCQDFLYMAAKPIEKEKNTDEIIYPADHKYKEYIVQDRWFVPTKFNIIDLLMLECDFKYKHKYSKKKIKQKYYFCH